MTMAIAAAVALASSSSSRRQGGSIFVRAFVSSPTPLASLSRTAGWRSRRSSTSGAVTTSWPSFTTTEGASSGRPGRHTRRSSTSTHLAAAPPTHLTFSPTTDLRATASATLLVGRHTSLRHLIYSKTDHYVSLFGFRPDPRILKSMHASLDGGAAAGSSASSMAVVPTVGPAEPRAPHRISVCALKDEVTRNNHPLSLHAVTDLVRGASPSKRVRLEDMRDHDGDDEEGGGDKEESGGKKAPVVRILALVEDRKNVGPMALAIARAFPIFSKKTKNGKQRTAAEEEDARVVQVTFLDADGKPIKDEASIRAAEAAAEGARLACRLVDAHPEELTTTAFAQECYDLFADDKAVTVEEICGDELKEKGYGGLYNVGRAAVDPPRLMIMTYDPPQDVLDAAAESSSPSSIALVGKGIVYDTGGLALKPRGGMCGMKHDMGGAAGLLGGFYAATRLRTPRRIRLLLCLAENAIGPTAFRNDDILDMYSGKTVEINNSDAEGRLVLADGVAHVAKNYKDVDLLVDMATLTGAQMVSTGQLHAAVLATTEELERRAVVAGLRSGDLCYPLLYAPELLKKEFNSKVADMKNSVKDRSNAQCSCAGHFIESHLGDYKGDWLHVDMAGPGTKAERGTGYGVGLALSLVGAPGFE